MNNKKNMDKLFEEINKSYKNIFKFGEELLGAFDLNTKVDLDKWAKENPPVYTEDELDRSSMEFLRQT